LLKDANEVVRYWAARGLLMLNSKASGARAALETSLDKDASASVRIAAAEALALLGAPDRPVRYLGAVLESQADARVHLQALNALTFIGEPARRVLPAIERATATAQDEYIRSASRYLSLVLRGSYTPESPVYQGRGARAA
jgi:HEAT repeat protein